MATHIQGLGNSRHRFEDILRLIERLNPASTRLFDTAIAEAMVHAKRRKIYAVFIVRDALGAYSQFVTLDTYGLGDNMVRFAYDLCGAIFVKQPVAAFVDV